MTTQPQKPRILTGLRANNDLTIGNYLGALLPMVDMAKNKAGEYDVNLFVPDLHSFTTPIDHSQLQAQIMQNLRVFVAAGLPIDHENVYIYRQSYIPAHSELTWILDCFTGFGEMNRMTQFKDKSQSLLRSFVPMVEFDTNSKSEEEVRQSLQQQHSSRQNSISVGLFNYPVLMAADILLYDTEYVPVGDDQTQHLEFTRDIAERMNNRFGDLFTVPKPVPEQHKFFGKDQGLRIKDLIDPTKKMSKSDESGRGVIFMSDSPEAAAKKVMGATTDSFASIKYDPKERPGISNLLQMYALLSGRSLKETIAKYEGQERYGDFKNDVAQIVSSFLRDFQANLAKVDDAAITKKLEQSEATMRKVAAATLLRVQRAVGLR